MIRGIRTWVWALATLLGLPAFWACGTADVGTAENTAAACGDDVDNDGDGATDCDDADCAAFCSAADADADADADSDADTDTPADLSAEADAEAEAEAEEEAEAEASADADTDADGTDVVVGCSNNGECALADYCRKESCSAEMGTCVVRPTTCDNDFAPVCGCDGVNYWNDCLRERHRVAASSAGECGAEVAFRCGGIASIDCPTPETSCAFLFESSAQCAMSDPMGVCWAIPAVCPAVVIGGQERPCGGDPSAACLDLCRAIAAGGSHFFDSSCPV